MSIKFLVLRGVCSSLEKGGVEVPILFLWVRGFSESGPGPDHKPRKAPEAPNNNRIKQEHFPQSLT